MRNGCAERRHRFPRRFVLLAGDGKLNAPSRRICRLVSATSGCSKGSFSIPRRVLPSLSRTIAVPSFHAFPAHGFHSSVHAFYCVVVLADDGPCPLRSLRSSSPGNFSGSRWGTGTGSLVGSDTGTTGLSGGTGGVGVVFGCMLRSHCVKRHNVLQCMCPSKVLCAFVCPSGVALSDVEIHQAASNGPLLTRRGVKNYNLRSSGVHLSFAHAWLKRGTAIATPGYRTSGRQTVRSMK